MGNEKAIRAEKFPARKTRLSADTAAGIDKRRSAAYKKRGGGGSAFAETLPDIFEKERGAI
jgi:hypothetical protein